MSITWGKNLKLTIFGQSHGAEIGMTLEGLPEGIRIDADELQLFMDRRAPGRNEWSSSRREPDRPVFTAGVRRETSVVGGGWEKADCIDTDTGTVGALPDKDMAQEGTGSDRDNRHECVLITTGAPITAVIRNKDSRPGDYKKIRNLPRPGHADYTARLKYGDEYESTGGGMFSGRMTAPLCIAGNICIQILLKMGISIAAQIDSIGGLENQGEFPDLNERDFEAMKQLMLRVKNEGDSVGGMIRCRISGLPGGIGGPMTDGLESSISNVVFGIPAVKAIEFGSGFRGAALRGSENNDSFVIRGGAVVTETNNCGGILGGISTGGDVDFRVAFKPAPSIGCPQKSVNLEKMEATILEIGGRHDPCVVPRAVPCVEAAAALAILDELMADAAVSEGGPGVFCESGQVKGAEMPGSVNEAAKIDQGELLQGSLVYDKLTDCRKQIDDIDRRLVHLLAMRMDCSAEIGRIKREQGIPVPDAAREEAILCKVALLAKQIENRNSALHDGSDLAEDVGQIYRRIFELSRKRQTRIEE